MAILDSVKLWAAIAAIAFSAWFARSYTVAQYEKEIAEQNQKVAELEAENERKSAKVVTKFVERVKTIEVEGATIVKEIPVYVTKDSDAKCTIPTGFVRLHDRAANGDPGATGSAHDAPSGVDLSTVAQTVTGNYLTCRKTAEQLTALQEWVRETHPAPARK
jgi:uncharacterized coiled-coil protein SlyX